MGMCWQWKERQMKTVALVTTSHRSDIERFRLLCDSIDRFVTGYERHYVIVNDDDMSSFAPYNTGRRVVLPCSQLLPWWLKLLPTFLLRNGRRVWWSFYSAPVHGWQVQQLVKIAAVSRLPEERFCIIDSDNVFFRRFDAAAYAGRDQAPLYADPKAINPDMPLHTVWLQNCDRLLGLAATELPADDYIGNAIVWDKLTLQQMISTIERVTGRSWAAVLCRTRKFSEYLLYGCFVRQSAQHMRTHELVTVSPVSAYWEEVPLDSKALAAMVRNSASVQVALCIESYSRTPLPLIRSAVGL
jgi:hypothetical protein